ncbi:hypothetical protein Bca101_006856 [Brassica carinata]
MNASKLVTVTANDALDGLKSSSNNGEEEWSDSTPNRKPTSRSPDEERFPSTEETPRQGREPHRHNPTTTETKWRIEERKPDLLPTLKADHPRATAATTAPYLQRTRRSTGKDKPRAQEAHRRSHANPEKTSKAERPNTTRQEAKGKRERGRGSPAGAGRALTRRRTGGESQI